MRSIRGFTLVELIVTIAVLAIIVTLAIPSFIQTIRKSQLTSETQNFVNLLAETRSEAIFKQSNRKLTINGSDGFRNWMNSTLIIQESGDSSVTYNRLGQSISTVAQCFVFKHENDSTLKSFVYVQRQGVVLYSKTSTNCLS